MTLKTITEHLLRDLPSYDDDFPPDNLVEHIAWCQKLLDAVPEEYQDSATIDIDGEEYSVLISVYYEKLETEEDVLVREERVRKAEAVNRTQELRLLRDLKEKYEGVK